MAMTGIFSNILTFLKSGIYSPYNGKRNFGM